MEGKVVRITGANNAIGLGLFEALAEKIGSRRPVVTPGLIESMGVFVTTMMPRLMARFLSGSAAAAREESVDSPADARKVSSRKHAGTGQEVRACRS